MSAVIYDKQDRIAYVMLNRPGAKNAINPEVHRRLWEVWQDFRDDDRGRYGNHATPLSDD